MAKWNRGSKVKIKGDGTGEVRMTDSGSGRYVVDMDDGGTRYVMENQIEGPAPKEKIKKANFLDRRKKSR